MSESGRFIPLQHQEFNLIRHFTHTTTGYYVLPIAELRQRIRRELFRSIADLQTAINRYLKEHNDDPKPFIWTKPVDVILAKLDRLPVPSV